MAMELNPGGEGLVTHKLHILMPAIRQGHHQGPGLAERPGARVEHAARIAKIHLGFATRLAFHPHRRQQAMRLKPVEKAVDRGQGPRIAALAQPLPASGARHALGVEVRHHLAVGFHRGHCLRWWGQFQRRGHQLVQRLHRR
jgi:hypothetical protein